MVSVTMIDGGSRFNIVPTVSNWCTYRMMNAERRKAVDHVFREIAENIAASVMRRQRWK